jgi:hypothetical protein
LEAGVLFTPSRRQHGARVLAAKEPAQDVPTARDPFVDVLGNPDHAGNPHDECHEHEQRQAHPDEPDRPRAAMDASARREAMNCSWESCGTACAARGSLMGTKLNTLNQSSHVSARTWNWHIAQSPS